MHFTGKMIASLGKRDRVQNGKKKKCLWAPYLAQAGIMLRKLLKHNTGHLLGKRKGDSGDRDKNQEQWVSL